VTHAMPRPDRPWQAVEKAPYSRDGSAVVPPEAVCTVPATTIEANRTRQPPRTMPLPLPLACVFPPRLFSADRPYPRHDARRDRPTPHLPRWAWPE
jgi:hypothetical protein